MVRTFLQKSYPVIKKHNPYVPVLIREAFGVPARVYARYGIIVLGRSNVVEFGLENKINLDGLSEKECEDAVEKLVQQKAVGEGNV
jgi:NADH dehydrogenase (ubiquinone) 1 alpha subcomplex subunit 2